MTPPAEADRLGAFGRWLAREREFRGVGREEVTRATRLAPDVIEALESGDRRRLPSRAYAVGYLRSYATAVGLDADEVVLRWEESLDDAAREAAPPRRRYGRAVAVAAVVIALAALAAVLLS